MIETITHKFYSPENPPPHSIAEQLTNAIAAESKMRDVDMRTLLASPLSVVYTLGNQLAAFGRLKRPEEFPIQSITLDEGERNISLDSALQLGSLWVHPAHRREGLAVAVIRSFENNVPEDFSLQTLYAFCRTQSSQQRFFKAGYTQGIAHTSDEEQRACVVRDLSAARALQSQVA
ncbi:hypothetical protein CSA80_03435 [Candidatus Saccharibacteria bacterium]|nr:MAG: hypothetical protein CSA80_03435 [Candidatus Saccharibacteria bacterium]